MPHGHKSWIAGIAETCIDLPRAAGRRVGGWTAGASSEGCAQRRRWGPARAAPRCRFGRDKLCERMSDDERMEGFRGFGQPSKKRSKDDAIYGVFNEESEQEDAESRRKRSKQLRLPWLNEADRWIRINHSLYRPP